MRSILAVIGDRCGISTRLSLRLARGDVCAAQCDGGINKQATCAYDAGIACCAQTMARLRIAW
jgi:hypothetical protein